MPAASIPFLVIALTLVAAAAAAVWYWAGWADAMWVTWLGLFVAFEAHAVKVETGGDTLSERIHAWFRLKTPAGRAGFFVIIGTLFAWLSWHLITLQTL